MPTTSSIEYDSCNQPAIEEHNEEVKSIKKCFDPGPYSPYQFYKDIFKNKHFKEADFF